MTTPQEARAAVRELLLAHAWAQGPMEDACLAVSEVVTNALLHGGGVVGVELDADERRLHVEVADRNATPPALGPAPPPASIAGRGLRIVDALVDRWGVDVGGELPTRKRVWFEIDRPGP